MKWMIYGANGYTGELIAREAVQRGERPVLAGRSAGKLEALASELGLEHRVFSLDDRSGLAGGLMGIDLVLHCAGPFSATSAPMIEACLAAKAHYLDITGEISVFEHAHAQHARAQAAGIVVCPGVGFDVIPTDCVAAALKAALPDATHLALGFDSRSGFSPGTAKTSVEGLAQGGKVRENGVIRSVPLAYHVRRIDFGDGEKLAMTIPWGDVSTAFHTTGIANIETFIPGSPSMIANAKRANYFRWLLGMTFVQNLIKARIAKTVKGPSAELRDKLITHVWGEARNAAGTTKTARIQVANGYALTVTGALAVIAHLDAQGAAGGAYTPSRLCGAGLVEQLPGSGAMRVD
ncbi:saccharopine dehydrogenase family protein [Solimonas marina]|uniref:NAD(P)H-binding protein n=1 Tax=Solimonas marina TaxID=2714601 RepID=A0A969WCZ8_9GAMM|nr:saccharopine dehydrogenase NADP-binding domain-containing protein [Solimonas marina]NKF23944.1 NAD(P)H-binding protein [Solimonas marina]